MWRRDAGNYVELLLLDSNVRNSVRVCTPAKLPCRWVVEGSGFVFRVTAKICI
jgi:hypothetical protein